MNRHRTGIFYTLGLALAVSLLGIGILFATPSTPGLAHLESTLPGQALPSVGVLGLDAMGTGSAPIAPQGDRAQDAAPSNLTTASAAAAHALSPAPARSAQARQPIHTLDWQPHAGRTAAPPPVTDILVDLPTFTLRAGADGSLRAGPLAVTEPGDLGLTPELLARLTAADVQHVQIANREAGLFVESNNLPVLGLEWDEASLARMGQLLAKTGTISQTWAKAAPLLAQIHLDVVADLSAATRRADQEAIPVDTAIRQADPVLLADAAGRESAILDLPIRYQADGTPRILGLGALQLELLTGVSLSATQLTPEQMITLTDADIREIRLSTEADGLHIFVNGEALPTLLWAQGEVANLVELAAALVDPSAGDDAPLVNTLTDTLGMVEQLVRLMQTVNVNVVVQFP